MDVPGTSSTSESSPDAIQENMLTNKFLSGEMSFAEYSTQWYGGGDVEFVADESRRMGTELQLFSQSSKKPRRGGMHLSAALLGLMGEANLRFVRGDKETAEKMCHELIKQVPTAPEPYQTLAQIYEHDEEKSLQFSLLAAHLSPPDVNEWLRLAAISKQRNDIKQELICYSQAIKADPHNLSIHLKRLELVNAVEESKLLQGVSINLNPVKCYHKIVTSMPPTAADTITKYARLAATIYHNHGEIDKALEVMSTAYKKCPSNFTLADTNIFLELLIARKQYQMCLEVFIANLGVDIEAEIQTVKNADGAIEEQTDYLNCCIPHDLPIDLKSKLLICFIHLGAHSLVQSLLIDFLANDVEKAGDLYMDIEEALSAVGEHELAIKILEPLVKNHSFDLGAVWLKHADCLYNLGREDDAIESYHRVLKHAPQHSDARRRLFNLHEKRGDIEKALHVLQQDYKYVVSAGLMYEQCNALKKYKRFDEYLEVGEALLSKSFMKFRHPDEIKFAFQLKINLLEVIHEFRISKGEHPYDENALIFDEDEAFKFTPEQEWDFFKDLLGVACKHKKYFAMQRLAYGAMMSKNLLSTYRPQMEFYCLQASFLAKDYHNTFKLIKDLTIKMPTPRAWNLLNLVLHYVDDVTPKFLNRLFQKDCQSYSVVKNLFLGNSFLSSGRYLVALKYFLEHHNQSRDPLSALLIGITMLVMAAQRTVDKHHNLILQGMCYLLKYQNLRKCDQETNYNLGRAYQMLRINNLAIEYYERALAAEPILKCPQHGSLNLTKEAAFNLYLIYKDHSPLMARRCENSMNMATELVVPANDIFFSDFCNLLDHLKKKEKKEQDKILSNFITDFRIRVANTSGKKSASFFPVLRLVLPDKDRERAPYNMKDKKLGALLVKVLSIGNESKDGRKLLNFRSVHNSEESDFAGVAYYTIKNRIGTNSGTLTIGEINELLDKIATAEVGNKNPILHQAFSYALKSLTADQVKWFLRIILKDLKLAIGSSRILAAFHPDAPDLYNTLLDLSKVCEELEEGETRPLELGLQLFFAVSPMLSERLDVTRVPLVLAANRSYLVENKFDGERFQLHMENGVFEYFSRKGFRYSDNYGKTYDGDGLLTPLLKDCFSPVVSSVILDGEMMGWHKYHQCFGSKGMAFDVKKITANSKYRPCYCVFDVLYLNGKSLAGPPDKGGLPLTHRLEILKTLFTDREGVIMHSEYSVIQDRSEVLTALNKAIDDQEEGIVVKDTESYYIPNKRNAGWYKIKPEYTESATSDLDLVIVGADEAAGRRGRAGRARNFTLACADVVTPGEAPHRWLVLGKVATGVTFEERERICALLEKQWVPWRQAPPPPHLVFCKEKADFWIKPEQSLVVQVRATEFVRTSGLETEYTLRFPRIVAIRDDKPVTDILTFDQLKALVAESSSVVKLSKKRINENQMEGVEIPRRKRPAKVLQVASQFRLGASASAGSEVVVTSRALEGRALHVLSDDEDCSKAELIKIIESHAGRHHENIGPDTWCCVVGQLKYRARMLIQDQKLDIVSTAWLRSLPPSDSPCTLAPLDMLSIKPETKRKLSRHYDRHRDSYTEEIDVETLKKCLDKWDEPEIYLTNAEMLKLDKELFGDHNPFSYLRPCFIHFTNENTLLEIKAKMYGANVCPIDSPNLSHVVVKRDENIEEIKNKINSEAVIVLDKWLEECFENEKIVSKTEFVLQ